MTENRKLPSAVETEKIILNAVIESPEIYHQVAPYINDDTLFAPIARRLWKKVGASIDNRDEIDLISILNSLDSVDTTSGLDAAYLGALSGYTSSATDYTNYAKAIYEKWLLRRIITASETIYNNAYNKGTEVYNTMLDAHSLISELMQMQPGKVVDINSILAEVVTNIKEGPRLLRTGYEALDRLAGGMTRGELTVIAGRPGHCKTTMLVNLVKNLLEQGLKVMVFNREMTNVEMMNKILILESGQISYNKLRRGLLTEEDMGEVKRTADKISQKYNSNVFVTRDDLVDFHSASAEVRKFKPDVIIDDYVQLIAPENGSEVRRIQIETIMNNYKRLVKVSNAVGIIASQISRGIETRGEGSRPMLSDLSESASIEHTAENVIFMYYDHKIYGARSKDGPNVLEVICAKQRYGTTGMAKFGFNGDIVRLYGSVQEWKQDQF
jgi:replicative DNA helicase